MGLRTGIFACKHTAFAIWSGFLTLLLGLVVFSTTYSGDYDVTGVVGGDNAGPGLRALLHGSLSGYIDHQPVVGLTSILLRLPVMAVGAAFGAGNLLNYQIGAVVCTIPLALLAAWLMTRPDISSRQRLMTLLAVLFVISSPIVKGGIAAGHPEGTLSKVLAVAAVLSAMRGRVRWAAVLLGLAVSAKESALIALPPVLITLPRNRREVLLISGGVFFLLTGAIWLSDPSAFMRAIHGEGHTPFLTPLSPLWVFAAPVHVGGQLAIVRVMPWGLHRVSATALCLALALTVAALWYVQARRRGYTCDPLAMLTLLGILRCVCDSTHEAYYATSIVIPLAAWESQRDRLPVMTALICVGNPIFYDSLGRLSGGDLYLTSSATAILLIGVMARNSMVAPREAALAVPRWARPRWPYVLSGAAPLVERD